MMKNFSFKLISALEIWVFEESQNKKAEKSSARNNVYLVVGYDSCQFIVQFH